MGENGIISASINRNLTNKPPRPSAMMLWPGLFVTTMGENREAKRRSYAARGLGMCERVYWGSAPTPAAPACDRTTSHNGFR